MTSKSTIEEQTLAAAAVDKHLFVYIYSPIMSSGCERELDDEQYEGCLCIDKECSSNCSCVARFGRNYDSSHCLILNKLNPIFECNSECNCDVEKCSNRLTQQDSSYKFESDMEIFAVEGKGYGVRCQKAIDIEGTFIGLYLGEILTINEAKQRSTAANYEHNYLLLYTEHNLIESKTYIDARHYGNWTRFINHSCDPNLELVPIRIDNNLPCIAFFTSRPISANEELSYSYGFQHDDQHDKSFKKCLCSSVKCKGFLPFLADI
ncbi:unnamed protein product [Didymodactylos carnosus]|uniref:Uncharacterized protein n=1 Tax=Didymodactylos carnosus TaxID=1234261 RepID=A0A813ZKZ2_9BILA|nr:unnamed protein product [Didymodactylos carnosus]CAF1044991.1 unnamed protein product [Didymodactylos carnosus]CAF3682525.1 unnamed protein product [Didymodactylos carnosus]CAF3813062.1 unnamed protein product [Didymodactylos carnosus]